jgi:hypothetical protein
MLLTDRRRRLIYFCLAGMEMTWFAPFFLVFFQPVDGRGPLIVFLELFGVLLAFMLMLELMNLLQLDWPFYELAVVGLIVLSSLLFVRLWLYGSAPLGVFGWLGNTLGALFNFQQGVRPELVLILTNVLLWQRAANATSRDIGFFSVGVSFRLGVLLLLVSASLLNYLTGQNMVPFLWLYFGLSLMAVAVARTYERATGAQSAGSLPSLRRLGQLLLAVGVTVGVAALLALFLTPDRVNRALAAWLKPLWTVLSPLARILLQVLFWLLEPILIWLSRLLTWLLAGLDLSAAEQLLESLRKSTAAGQVPKPGEVTPLALPPWVWIIMRYFFVLLAIAVALGLVMLFLDRIRVKTSREEAEKESGEEITLGGPMLGRGVRWLRDMAGLVRRFGLSRQLLAAISVQNIYANLCRLARQRGYPRRPSQPPDDYLPVLARAFVGQEEALARITATYMQVHYGDQPVTAAELVQLRQDYQRVRKAEKQGGEEYLFTNRP